MINNKKELKEWLRYERNRYYINHSFLSIFLHLAGSEKHIIWAFQRRLRLSEYYHNTHKPIRECISHLLLNHYRNKYGLRIGLNVCNKGLRIKHLGSILINGNARIGKDVTFHIHTAIVAKGNSDEVPIIGHRCVIGVGATIVGGIRLADGVMVGANALVCKDELHEDVTIVGNPARRIV